ncbi:MAG: hypothetical protein V2J10_10115 [Wenzhouxiangella sp.]|jgi:hypothetical protein|nr:hypothetical protein [Wenzhouxiangella sp.]
MHRFVLFVFSVFGSTPVLAELVNPTFDSDFSGWDIHTAEVVSWSPDDAGGSANSGSVEQISPGPGSGGVGSAISQCIDVQDVEFPLLFRASAKVFEEGEPGVSAVVLFFEYRGPDCTNFVGFVQDLPINLGADDWQSNSVLFSPDDAQTRTVAIRLGILKEQGTGEGGRVRYDNVVFGSPTNLFQDRFEILD